MRGYRRWQEKQLSFLVGDQREGREKVLMGGRLFQSDTYCKKRRTRQQHQLTCHSVFFTEGRRGESKFYL